MMLEDDFTYVLKKALAGCGLTPDEAAELAGLPEISVLAFLRGSFSADSARRLARVLGLAPEAFARHPDYLPEPLAIPGIARIKLPFGPDHVNAWLIEGAETIILFDAGMDAPKLWAALIACAGRPPDRALITHAHRDHIGGLSRLLEAGVPVHAAGVPGSITTRPGDIIRCGPFTIRALDLSGHADPALGFHIEGLDAPLLIVGDALFAGSIGGCPTPKAYLRALGNLRSALRELPASTILLPGHGPATTLAQELQSNPFLP